MFEIKSRRQFKEEVINCENRVVVDFYTPACGPCRSVRTHLIRIDGEIPVKICAVNCEELPVMADTYGVTSVPTIIVFEGGKVIDQASGARDYRSLYNMITQGLTS